MNLTPFNLCHAVARTSFCFITCDGTAFRCVLSSRHLCIWTNAYYWYRVANMHTHLHLSHVSVSILKSECGCRQCAISMFGLRRSFVKRPAFWRRLLKKERSTEAVAVKGNWLGIQQGQPCQAIAWLVKYDFCLIPGVESAVHCIFVHSPLHLRRQMHNIDIAR